MMGVVQVFLLESLVSLSGWQDRLPSEDPVCACEGERDISHIYAEDCSNNING